MSTLPPVTAAALGALLAASPTFASQSINALGDSISSAYVANSQFNDPTYQAQLAALPAWAPNTAYAVGNLVRSTNGYAYRCITAGTTGTTAPTAATGTITDGSVSWNAMPTLSINKSGQHMLSWAEWYSNGALRFDMAKGMGGLYQSLTKVIVYNGGSGYAAGDTVTYSNGAVGTLTIVGGVIVAAPLTNPGCNGSPYVTINTSTGSGAVLTPVMSGTGTYGVPGCRIVDCRARLADQVALGWPNGKPDIMVVHIGTNDATGGTAYASAWSDLKWVYDTLQQQGVKVVAVPVTPRAYAVTTAVTIFIKRLNRAIRFYCSNNSSFNTLGLTAVALADPTAYWTDGTTGQCVGGTGGVAYAVTDEGLHNSNRGAAYSGYAVALACQKWLGAYPARIARAYAFDDGYDSVMNPGGNMLEGYPWQASTTYALGQQCSNGAYVYRCTTAGTTAASGGPTTTGTAVVDGTAKWDFMGYAKMSVLGSGVTGTIAAASGVTITGNVATGLVLQRGSGSASGTLTATVENPWSNGQAGTRLSLAFSLGQGTVGERWDLLVAYGNYGAYALRNITAADLGVTRYVMEWEVEVSNVAMLNCLRLFSGDGTSTNQIFVGPGPNGVAGHELIPTADASVTDPLVADLGGALPNRGIMKLRTEPFIFPVNVVNFVLGLSFGFNASGAANTAKGTFKINRIDLSKYGVV